MRIKTIQKNIIKKIDAFSKKYDCKNSIIYNCSNDDIIQTDGYLYDILNYGSTDYKFGIDLYNSVQRIIENNNCILENLGCGIFKIYKP